MLSYHCCYKTSSIAMYRYTGTQSWQAALKLECVEMILKWDKVKTCGWRYIWTARIKLIGEHDKHTLYMYLSLGFTKIYYP